LFNASISQQKNKPDKKVRQTAETYPIFFEKSGGFQSEN